MHHLEASAEDPRALEEGTLGNSMNSQDVFGLLFCLRYVRVNMLFLRVLAVMHAGHNGVWLSTARVNVDKQTHPH